MNAQQTKKKRKSLDDLAPVDVKKGKWSQELTSIQQVAARAVRSLAFDCFGTELFTTSECRSQLLTLIGKVDRKKHFKLFEAIAAYESNLYLWENLPVATLEAKNALRYKARFPDFGIDCASADLSHSVQAKWYDKGRTVSFRSAATFFSYSTILGSQKLQIVMSEETQLCTTAKRLPNIEHVQISNERMADIILFCASSTVIATPSPALTDKMDESALQQSSKPEFTLRKCQQDAIQVISAAIAKNQYIIKCQMPCGSGKSIVISHVIQQKFQSGQKWIVFEPSLFLQHQMQSLLARELPQLKLAIINGENELPPYGWDLIVCTNQSARKIEDFEFDMVICDEGHHVERFLSQGEDDAKEEREEKNGKDEKNLEDEKVEDKIEGYLKVMANLQTKHYLLVSATLDEDEEFPPDYEYRLEQAIQDNVLCDYELCVPVLDGMGPDFNTKPTLAQLVKENRHVWNSVLAYCNCKTEAKAFQEELMKLDLSVAYMDATTPMDERKHILTQFEQGAVAVIVSIQVLGEGVDVPIADTCLFVNPRSSHDNVVQCVGRILRTHPSKTLAHIVLPALHEDQELARFLRIMQHQDPRLGKSFASKSPGRLNLVYPLEETKFQTKSEMQYVEHFTRLGELMPDSQWWTNYNLLVEFAAKFNRLPKQRELFNDYQIGNWIMTQRIRYNHGKLEESRKKALEMVQKWYWGKKIQRRPPQSWQSSYDLLLEYQKEFKEWPRSNVEYKSFHLGQWAVAQNTRKLSDEQRDLLKRVPYPYQMQRQEKSINKKVPKRTWEEAYDLLVQFCVKYHRFPKQKEKFHGFGLGSWMMVQKRCRVKLNLEQIGKLEQLKDWKWAQSTFKRKYTWKESYDALVLYANTYHGIPTIKETVNGYTLGRWVSQQRENYHSGRFKNKIKIKLLEDIPGWTWKVHKKSKSESVTWNPMWLRVEKFQKEFKRLPKGKEVFETFKVGQWLTSQHHLKTKGKLSDEKQKKLESLPGWKWRTKTNKTWNEHLALLEAYISEHKRLPAEDEKFQDANLGVWYKRQCATAKLTTIKRTKLAAVITKIQPDAPF